jgi:Ca2+-binding RTX toxin-like protein
LSDIVVGSEFGDTIQGAAFTMSGGGGNDSMSGSAATMDGGAGNDTLIGSASADWLQGGDGTDLLQGGAGDDRLYGDAGIDTLAGGTGNDTYAASSDDVVIEAPGEGTQDRVNSESNAYVLGPNVEWLTYYGFGTFDGTGNELDNWIASGNLDDVLRGMGGADLLEGWMGNDTLDGGFGADVHRGGQGLDTFVMRAGDGGGTLQLADVIQDFEDGADLIGLAGGLAFADLIITQGTGPNINDTIVQRSSGEYLVLVQNTSASNLTALDFTTLP